MTAGLLLALITAVAIVGYRAPRLFTDVFAADAFDPEAFSKRAEDESVEVPNVQAVSFADADAVIVAESDSFFTPTGAKAMRHVVQALEALPHVQDVMWLDRAPVINIFGLPEPLLPRYSSSPSLFAAAREKAARHPFVNGQLMSEDGRTLLLFVRFDYLGIQDDDSCTTLLDETATRAAADYDSIDIDFIVTGQVPTVLTAVASHEKNQLKYQLIAYGMILMMSVILFRGITSVILVAMAPGVGVFWTLGIIQLFEFGDNPFIDVVLPILISLVGLTDGVHLLVQIRRNRDAGMSPVDASRNGIQQVGLACGLTSVTTAIGFGSLSLAHHAIVREFGWACVIGVLLTFVAVVIIIPLACASPLGRRIHEGQSKGLVDKNLDRISGIVDWVLKYPRWFSLTGIALTLVLFLISLSLRPDERRENALPPNSDAAVAIRKLDQAMGGLEYSRVDISWDDTVAADASEVLAVIREVDAMLGQEALIGYPISIGHLLDALPGDGQDIDRMSMLELLPPPLKRAFYTPEYRTATVSFRVQDLGIAAYGPVFERLQQELSTIKSRHPHFDFEMSGSAIWRWENLYQIVIDLAASLGTATFIIFITLALAYRSLRIGLISIVPNLFPLAVAGSWLVISGQNLEIVMVCAFTVCLGIAVDDTIHFLTRYLEERKTAPDESTAIRNAFTGVGTALIMTTIILVAGFMTVVSSDSRDHRIFASMGAITVTAALFGDLIFLPALLARFNKPAPRPASDSTSPSAN